MAKWLSCKANPISVVDEREAQTASICNNIQQLLHGTTFASDFLLLFWG